MDLRPAAADLDSSEAGVPSGTLQGGLAAAQLLVSLSHVVDMYGNAIRDEAYLSATSVSRHQQAIKDERSKGLQDDVCIAEGRYCICKLAGRQSLVVSCLLLSA